MSSASDLVPVAYYCHMDIALIRSRDGDRCARCGSSRDLHVHHRIMRSQGGGNYPENLITLCTECHHWVHHNPHAARREGLLLKATDNSYRFPVRHSMWPAGPVVLGPDLTVILWDEERDQPLRMPAA